jgi:hypothetical protein
MRWSLDSGAAIATTGGCAEARKKMGNHFSERAVSFYVHRFFFLALRKWRLRFFLCACVLLAAGCAHHHDASTDDSGDHPTGRHRHGNTENIRPSSPELGGF